MVEINKEDKEVVVYSYDIKKGNYIKDVYYEFETEKAVKFMRKSDKKYFWIPKSFIKGGWNRDKDFSQNVYVRDYYAKFPCYWEEREAKLIKINL